MPGVVGPYDGRKARRKRCDGCVKRKTKCDGGAPCASCKKTNRPCQMAMKPTSAVAVFVHHAQSGGGTMGVEQALASRRGPIPSTPALLQPPSLQGEDVYIPCFFTSFLRMNAFASTTLPISTTLLETSKSTPSLRAAITALGALHLTRLHPPRTASQRNPLYPALKAYAHAVDLVQTHLACATFTSSPSALWTTFLLGLFELMRDSTGTNWLSHFLHGTSTLLRLQDPATLTHTGTIPAARRTFFLATRIFEIARALVYGDVSFLSSGAWERATRDMWRCEGIEVEARHTCKEVLFDVLPRFAALQVRVCAVVERNSLGRGTAAQTQLAVCALAREGMQLRRVLDEWYRATLCRVATDTEKEEETERTVALVYHAAMSIYLDGTFSYFPLFTNPSFSTSPSLSPPLPILIPNLAPSQIISHIATILRLSPLLLSAGVAGVLLFVPLRIAGARARDAATRGRIRVLLEDVLDRGWVVAGAFVRDLEGVWGGGGDGNG